MNRAGLAPVQRYPGCLCIRRRPARRRTDRLADAPPEHVDSDALWLLIEHGPTPGVPLLPPGA